MDENKRKHLEMIQGVINRMGGNLFFLKGWSITIIAGLLALSAKDYDAKLVALSLFPMFIFWILDGFFLSQERLFRALYDDVRKLNEMDIDFSMDTTKYKSICRNTWFFSMFASTPRWFYLSLFVMLFAFVLIN